MGCFDVSYDYKSLGKLISNHSMIGLSVLFFSRLYNFDLCVCHFDSCVIYFHDFINNILNKMRNYYFLTVKLVWITIVIHRVFYFYFLYFFPAFLFFFQNHFFLSTFLCFILFSFIFFLKLFLLILFFKY